MLSGFLVSRENEGGKVFFRHLSECFSRFLLRWQFLATGRSRAKYLETKSTWRISKGRWILRQPLRRIRPGNPCWISNRRKKIRKNFRRFNKSLVRGVSNNSQKKKWTFRNNSENLFQKKIKFQPNYTLIESRVKRANSTREDPTVLITITRSSNF